MVTKQQVNPAEMLRDQVRTAAELVPLQTDPVLLQQRSKLEMRREAQNARRIRRAYRRDALAAELEEVRALRRARRAVRREEQTRRSMERLASVELRRLQTYRRAMWTSRGLVVLVCAALAWSAVNVQSNLAAGMSPTDPLWWLSFAVEVVISGFVVALMLVATSASLWGVDLDRGKMVRFEIGLMAVTVGLNVGPHLAAGEWGTAAQFSAAPVMVGAGMWLHGWIAQRYSLILAEADSRVATAEAQEAVLPERAAVEGSSAPAGANSESAPMAHLDLRRLAEEIVDKVGYSNHYMPDRVRVVEIVETILTTYESGESVDAIANQLNLHTADVVEVIDQAGRLVDEHADAFTVTVT
ncbi:hypothetical protein [Nocardia camponoti]|uniref:DUF2637 domain-containing protein n=1 Tax=Nocardia camponoti TaxID=1616106 RepID=A0A917QUY1_9NOCA|nr:hypothetical protein [Nocardia camponoti]GGK68582.1 hypothetical protein GCM10011591_45890 [Nocardia camponoti]